MKELHNKLVVFQEKEIRRVWHNEEWWFVISDVLEALTDTKNVVQYWKDMKKRDPELGKGGVQISTPLLVETTGGKQKMNCTNTEGIFRIIQSIPSPKAEPFKQWLASVGYERVKEIENPELAAERARQLYREKGYPDDWIEMRMKSIEIREQLTDEWQNRGVQKGIEYAILTAEISKATFGMTPKEYQEHKNLKRENLRDHMTNLELIFSMLGEESTKQEAVKSDAQGFVQNKVAAKKGGKAAGKALDAYEKETGQEVVTDQNYLKQIEAAKQNKRLKKGE